MLPRGELQFPGPDDHLARHAVGIGARNAVLDGSVPERLDEHGDERRPQPQTALDMPSRAVSIGRTRPIFEKSASTCRHSPSESEWRRSQTTMPSQTETGVLGTVLKWCVPGASIRS